MLRDKYIVSKDQLTILRQTELNLELIKAVKSSGFYQATTLLILGADINIKFAYNKQKCTLLRWAIEEQVLETVRWLLKNNADPNVPFINSNITMRPLNIANIQKQEDIIKLLLEYGVKTDHFSEKIDEVRFQPVIKKEIVLENSINLQPQEEIEIIGAAPQEADN